MGWVDRMHSILALSGQEPVGPPGVVQVLPDDYVTKDPERFGTLSVALGAGGAGTRAEILLLMVNLGENYACEIRDMLVQVTTADFLQIVRPSGVISGLTAVTVNSFDVPAGSQPVGPSPFGVFTKATAAASASNPLAGNNINLPVANTWYTIPGRILLRSGPTLPGAALLRPATDNIGIRLLATWRILEKRQK